MGLLPGALTRNAHLRFECRDVYLRVETEGPFTDMGKGEVLRLPIAHADGRYHTTAAGLAELERNDQIAFRYSTRDGAAPNGSDANPNGSVDDIAGVYNRQKNVLGMMPHPERASEPILGNDDGLKLFTSLRRHLGFK
jgi:phosphoribosylformylglycinamidine synthase subunit PurQ / glutaminase